MNVTATSGTPGGVPRTYVMSSIYVSYPGDQMDVPTVLACLSFLFFAFIGVVSIARWITALYHRTQHGPASAPEPCPYEVPTWVHTAISSPCPGIPWEEVKMIRQIQRDNDCFLEFDVWQRCLTVTVYREEAGSRYSEELPENAGLHPGMWEAMTYQEVLRLANEIFNQGVEG